jgi:UDP-N-acetylmuramyl pentapeptide phosphotransferase/UDP-N-acetylglucosamine-1-phosphate transferase
MTALYGFIVVTLAAFLATGLALKLLRRAQILDHPNERSSHSLPTPKGAGLALIPLLIAAWAWLAAQQGEYGLWPLLASAAGLCLLSWRDDLSGLPAGIRLVAQGLAVALGLYVLGPQGSVTQGLLPAWADHLFAWLAWLWFVNLFNFMDGIDGIAGVESLTVALGIALIATLDLALGEGYALLLAAVVLGFLPWNWSPARLFLGDSGSVPLGYLLGFLLVFAAYQGYWAAALILPAYYWADATLTLLKRLWRREKVWQAHRSHWYQRAALKVGHAGVCWRMGLLNFALLGLAVSTLFYGDWLPLFAAAGLVLAFLGYLSRLSAR